MVGEYYVDEIARRLSPVNQTDAFIGVVHCVVKYLLQYTRIWNIWHSYNGFVYTIKYEYLVFSWYLVHIIG